MQGTFVTDIGVVLAVAAVTGLAARAARQPTIVGYLLAGLIVGPYLPIPLFADLHRVEALAEFGVVLVMFAVGLEFRVASFLRALPVIGLIGLIEVGTLTYLGFTLGTLFGWSSVASLFLGTAIAISSTMVVTRVFTDRPPEGDVRDRVLSLLVLQDVIAIVLIAAMTGVSQGGGMAPDELALMLLRLVAVLVGMLVGGLLIVPRVLALVVRFDSVEILTVVSVGICFAFAVLAQQLGYSVALGAFIAGIVVAESGCATKVEHTIVPLRDVFAAIFFVSIGMTVDPIAAWEVLPLSLLVAAVVIVGQFVSVSVGGILSGIGMRRAITAGLALGQTGEFGFILAAIGTAGGDVSPALQPILVTVAVITAFTTPLLLGRSRWVIDRIDHFTPSRMQHLLGLYEAWLERVRADTNGPQTPLRRAITFLVVDTVGIVLIVGFAIVWLPEISELLMGQLGLSSVVAQVVVAAAVLLLCLPLLRGIVRAAIVVSHTISNAIVSSAADEDAAAGARIAMHSLRAMIYLAIVIGLGFPAVATLRPLMGGFYGIPILIGVVVVLSIVLWRRAGEADDIYRSGAREMAERLARRTSVDSRSEGGAADHGEAATPHVAPPADHGDAASDDELEDAPHELIPGLDGVAMVRIRPDADAAGRTLRELRLRALTGTTIMAIDQDGVSITLPTGSLRLGPGDVCAVAGSVEGVAKATELLTRARVATPSEPAAA